VNEIGEMRRKRERADREGKKKRRREEGREE
jgi:hypothetical protein